MPPLEPIDGSSSSAPVGAGAVDDDDMPPLEEIDGAPLPADVARELERAQAVRAALGPSGGDDDEDEDDDDDEDDEDEDWSDEDEDIYDDEDDEDLAASDSDGDDERIYPDGAPTEPLLPLLFVNRTFLHAARRQLYRTLKVQTPYVASLMHRALAAEAPAGWSAADQAAYDANATDVDGEPVRKNYLGDAVRTLSVLTGLEGAVSLGRGGAEHYIGLVALSRNVETLILQTRFYKSATCVPLSLFADDRSVPSLTPVLLLLLARSKPLLDALSGLSRLKDLDISSSDGKHPFIFTTARLYKLMQRSWPDLEVLIVNGLKPAEDGPQHEDDEMWDIVQDLEDAAWDEKQRSKLGDKDKDEGEAGEGGKVVVKDGAGDKKVARKPRGLTSLQLDGFNLTGSEMDLILQDVRLPPSSTSPSSSCRPAADAFSSRPQSAKTLKDLLLRDPGYLFSRTQLASTLLQFGHHLTDLELRLSASWDPAPKLLASATSPVYPVRPKDYVVGKPTPEHLRKLSGYTYLLDAVLPFLPKLKQLRFEGPYASTSVFSFFPQSLTQCVAVLLFLPSRRALADSLPASASSCSVAFGNCPDIKPRALAKLLNKTVTRTKVVTKPECVSSLSPLGLSPSSSGQPAHPRAPLLQRRQGQQVVQIQAGAGPQVPHGPLASSRPPRPTMHRSLLTRCPSPAERRPQLDRRRHCASRGCHGPSLDLSPPLGRRRPIRPARRRLRRSRRSRRPRRSRQHRPSRRRLRQRPCARSSRRPAAQRSARPSGSTSSGSRRARACACARPCAGGNLLPRLRAAGSGSASRRRRRRTSARARTRPCTCTCACYACARTGSCGGAACRQPAPGCGKEVRRADGARRHVGLALALRGPRRRGGRRGGGAGEGGGRSA